MSTDIINNKQMNKRLAVFAGYDSKNRIDDYVIYYLRELKKVADIILVFDNPLPESELKKVQDLTIHQICQRHGEYDFGSYKRGYLWAKENGLLERYDSLILCNDSMFGPFYPLEPIFEKFETKEDVDFWGMLCYRKKRIPLHVQSYFVVLKKQVFRHKIFNSFMASVQIESDKLDVIYKYEVRLSQVLFKRGFKADALFNETRFCKKAIKLIKVGFPFLKKNLFSPVASVVCREIKKYRTTLMFYAPHYDLSLIDDYIHDYIGLKKYKKHLFGIKMKSIKRFFFQKKIDKNGKMLVKIFKVQICRVTREPIFERRDIFVSVVMPVYNGSRYLSETVESILNQTYSNFEFVIVDDCSTDNSYEILQEYAEKDSRIKLFRTPQNFGNPGGPSAYGIDRVSENSKYIIMTDQDDISVKTRLEIQIRFMEKNPIVDISGAQMKLFGSKSRKTKPMTSDAEIYARLLTSSPISNPTIIFRKEFLDRSELNYKNQTSHDYLLLAEAAVEHKAFFANMQTVLLYYRCHGDQTSSSHKAAIQGTSDRVREYQLRQLGITDEAEINFFNVWKAMTVESTPENLRHIEELVKEVLFLNMDKNIYPHEILKERLLYLYRKQLLKSGALKKLIKMTCFESNFAAVVKDVR